MTTRREMILLPLLAIPGRAAVAASSSKALGRATAPITIDMFSDFQCPHCKEFHDGALGHMIDDFVNPGKVYLVRHYYLLSFKYSKLSAAYACAAERIGRYDKAAEVLWQTQQSWGQSGKVDEVVCSVLTPAEAAKVRLLAKDPSVMAEVEKDTDLGRSKNVTQTPTLIIKHKDVTTPLSGAVSYTLLKKFLDQLLTA